MKKLKIGNIILENNLVLAPISGMTDSVFRGIVKGFGCGLVVSGLVSSEALIRNHRKTFALLTHEENEHPLAIQLFGSKPDVLSEAAKIVEQKGADIIDINMGCPVKKVVKTLSGSAIAKDRKRAEQICRHVVRSVSVPVTIKIRSGWDRDSQNAVEISRMAEGSGIAAVSIHGRTVKQGYSGKADWNIIKEIKENVGIPVIGNGDIKTPEDAEKMFRQTGCDGIMIGRAALHSPWIFSDILAYQKTGEIPPPPSTGEIGRLITKHLKRLIDKEGEKSTLWKMRGYIAWYTRGIPNASRFRAAVNHIEDIQELKEEIERFFSGVATA